TATARSGGTAGRAIAGAAANDLGRVDFKTAAEGLHPAHPGGTGLSHQEGSVERPIWHQRSDRLQAHVLVCFLAFVLGKSLKIWQQRAGLGDSPRTILEELAHILSDPSALHHSTGPRSSRSHRP